MKNLLIIGPPRSGKTTLSKMIVKEIPIYNIINMDVIREGIYYSIFKSTDKNERKQIVENIFPNLIDKMFDQYQKYYNPDLYYIIEGDMLYIKDALEISRQHNVDIICIGTPNIKSEALFNRIRENALKYGCWTSKCSDEELISICQEIINQSKEEEAFAKNNNIVYLDTSLNNNSLLKYIENLKNK